MSERNADVSRRGFLQVTAGGAAATAASGAAAAQENQTQGNQTEGNQTQGNQTGGNETQGNETDGGGGGGGGDGGGGTPDFGGWLDDANEYDGSVVDETGSSEVTVEVGAGSQGFAFAPAAVHVDNGATVVWEWTGEGGAHNVVHDDGEFESGDPVAEAGNTFEYTFDEDGVYNYYCAPHQSAGMKASVVVGTDYPTAGGGGGGGAGGEMDPEHMGVPFQAHFVGLATVLMMVVSLIFTFFLLKYGVSAHAKGGNT